MTVALAATLAGGCATSAVHFEGAGGDGRLAPEVRYVLESDEGNEGSVTVHVHGWQHVDLDGRSTDTLRCFLTIDNASPDPLTLPLDLVSVRDDQQRRFRKVESVMDREPAGAAPDRTFTVGPRERTTVEALFDAGAPGALRTTGSIFVDWAYRFRGQETRHETRFLPIRIHHHTHVVYHSGFWVGPCW